MELRVFHTRVRVHPLMLMMVPLACRLGLKRETAALACALAVHEGAHMAAAYGLNVSMPELRLMPFGGSATIGNPYALSPLRLGLVAAAGPAANLLLLILVSALAHWNTIPAASAALCLRANLMLMAFNLLPALPLDGGRMLYAFLSKPVGKRRALGIGILAGRMLAMCLLFGAACLFFTRRVLNLSYIFAALFILAAAPGEREALDSSGVHALIAALSPLTKPLPVSLTAVDAGCPVRTALKAARPACANLYAVYEDGVLTAFTDDRTLLALALESGQSAPVGSAAAAGPSPKNNAVRRHFC